ncbi:Receptor-like protein 13 [Glycine max]|nr:Receptor-like protein 13 [Glycine max]
MIVMRIMKSTVGVCFLFFLLSEAIRCEGCWKEERDALLGLHSRFDLPYSWDGPDCCQWKGVMCNSSTGRVAQLGLWSVRRNKYSTLNYSDFVVFKDLKNLNLSENGISGCAGTEARLQNLEVLDLSRNDLDNAAILSCLDGLSSLKSLYLGINIFNTSSFHAFETLSSKLRYLELLDISVNSLTNDILPSLGGFTSLKELYLSDMDLVSDLHIQGLCLSLKNLEILDLSANDITSVPSGLSSLKSLYLSNCQLTSKSIFNISRFTSLEILDLSSNQLNERIPWHQDFHRLSNLEHLILDDNRNLENEFLKNIGELTSLKVLSLQYCDINGTLPPTDWFKLKKLEELDLSNNKFEGPLPSSFVNMTSLRKLEISYNHFIGNFDSNLASLTSLEYFGFIGNQFEVPVSFTPFANLSKIKFIYGEGNKVVLDSQHSLQTWIPKFKLQELIVSSTTETKSLPLPNFLLYQNNLTNIDLSGWKLEGDFPHWLLENNTKMVEALFRNCSFTGTFQLPMSPLPNIQTIDVSDNTINGQIPSNNFNSIYPNLQHLNLSGNNIQGSIPSELSQLSLMYSLDLSENQLSGKIPENILADGHPLQFLKLSNNMLEGPILNIPNGLETLILSHNRFTGRLPSNIFNSSLVSLDVSNNHLVGKIPSRIKNSSRLKELYMSNNHFEGSIPIELAEHEDLTYLDLSQNNLTGHVPSFANSPVKFMHLNNNHLSGLSKRMFNENSSLVMLDLSYNEISNNIQDMIQDLSYTRLNFLLLKGNHFIGDIPKQLCRLTDLSILDLSHNNFSGVIPNCLGKMPFEVEDFDLLLGYFSGWLGNRHYWSYSTNGTLHLPNVQEKTNFTSKKRTDTYMGSILVYMSGIDLSHNKLKGNIPSELGNLTKIRTLNLSHNDLTGQIPATFSHLVQTESLDLSFNMLNGQVPPQLTMLTSLEVFSVAHNNLSGPTPEFKEQFSTFDESSYEGNPFLCGLPLPKSCNPPPTVIPNDSNTDGHYDTLVDMYFFCVSFVVSYTSALLVTAAALYINPYWRHAWFYYMELASMNCYYFIVDNCSKMDEDQWMYEGIMPEEVDMDYENEEECGVNEPHVDCSNPFNTSQVFDSREDALRSNTNTGSKGRASFVLIGCEMSDEYRCRKKEFVRRDTGTRKCECPFKLRGKPVVGRQD